MSPEDLNRKEEYFRRAIAKSEHPYFSHFQQIVNGNLVFGRDNKEYSLFLRNDPFGTNVCRISEARAKRPRAIGEVVLEAKPQEECVFCPPKINGNTPEPKIIHGHGTTDGVPYEIVSVPNLHPFSPDHYVTIFSSHKPKLTDLTAPDLVAYVNSLYDLAGRFQRGGALGMWDFINWGPAAGASQSHPHAQRGPIIEEMLGSDMDSVYSVRESGLVSKLAYQMGSDPYENHINQLRDSDLFIFESGGEGGIFIYAPLAPKFPHQVDITVKRKVGNVLQLEKGERELMAGSMLGVFRALADKLGVTDVNVVLHQELFHLSDRSHYRMHWHIMPRNLNSIAGFELGVGPYVVPFFPEETASVLREHYCGKW